MRSGMRRGLSATAHEAFLNRARRDLDVTSGTGIPLAVRQRLERGGQWEYVRKSRGAGAPKSRQRPAAQPTPHASLADDLRLPLRHTGHHAP
jgi:hypothetical protein